MEINLNDIMESVNEFADSAVKFAKEVAAKTSKKTEEVVGMSKVKLDELKLENEIKALNQKLGAAVYEMTESGINTPEIIDCYVAELKVKKEQLAELKNQLSAMKKVVVCDACRSINPKDTFFCGRCGAPLMQQQPEESVYEAEESIDVEEILEQAVVDGATEEQAAEVAVEAEAEE